LIKVSNGLRIDRIDSLIKSETKPNQDAYTDSINLG
jgi:hypothetical protein